MQLCYKIAPDSVDGGHRRAFTLHERAWGPLLGETRLPIGWQPLLCQGEGARWSGIHVAASPLCLRRKVYG